MEPSSMVRVVLPDAMHGSGVVPDDEVVDRPLVRVDELRLRGPGEQTIEQLSALLFGHADDRRGAVAQDERVAPRPVVPDQRMDLPGHAPPRGELFLRWVRKRVEEGGLQ